MGTVPFSKKNRPHFKKKERNEKNEPKYDGQPNKQN